MIYFLGDVHGDFRHVRQLAQALPRPAAVVFLGDIEAQRPFLEEITPLLDAGIRAFWIRGNHDTDTKQNWDNLNSAMPLNIDGKVVEIAGVRVAGLGGIFREEIWHPEANNGKPHFESYEEYCRALDDKRPIRLRKKQALEASLRHFEHLPGSNASMIDEIRFGKELRHLSSIFWDTYASLWDQKVDILVTHEAPSCHPHGFALIDDLARAMEVTAVFHGHHHDCRDYRDAPEKLGFRVRGVGLLGITDEHGWVVREGDLDSLAGR